MAPQPESSGAITWLWVCSAVCGNLFAIYWLLRATLLQFPGLGLALKGWATRWRRHPARPEIATVNHSAARSPPISDGGSSNSIGRKATGPHEPLPVTDALAAADHGVGSPRAGHREEVDLVDAVLSRQLGSASTLGTAGSSAGSAAVLSSTGTPGHEEGVDCLVLRDYHGQDSQASCILEVQPQSKSFQLQWHDLNYHVPQATGTKQLLRGVWGSVASGQLMALLGPSGAGKSTLLELLARRRAPTAPCQSGTEADTGQSAPTGLFLNGAPVSAQDMQRVSSFVPQDDVLLPQMSVWETLQLHAALRLPPGTSPEVRAARQEEVMSAMGLTKQKQTLVGGDLPGGLLLRGLSGGERKRLAICTGLLPQPQILFADEPTSGLDAFAALTVMAHLAATARDPRGCAVVASIHQPRAAIWDMIDKALLLAQGRMVFEGPVCEMLPWLSHSLPPLLGLPPGQPPFDYHPELHGTLSDWAIDLVSLTDAEVAEQALAAGSTRPTQLGVTVDSSTTPSRCAPAGSVCVWSGAGGHAWVHQAADVFLDAYLNNSHNRVAEGDPAAARTHTECLAPAVATTHQSLDSTGASEVVAAEAPHHAHVVTTVILPAIRPGCAPAESAAAGSGDDRDAQVAPAAVPQGSSKRCQAGCASWWSHYRVLVWREAVASVRNPADVAGRMLTFVWVAMVGNFLLYGGGAERDTAGSIRIRLAWLYFTLFFYMVMPFLFMSVFTADKRYFLADVTSGLYKPGTYYAAKLTASLPLNMLISLAFLLTAYGMFGFRHSALAVIQVSSISVVFSLVSLQWIFFATAISPNQDIAFVLAVGFAVVNLLINGLFIGPMDPAGLPWVRSLRYISAMDYAWQGVAAAELRHRVFDCSAGGSVSVGLDALGLFPQFLPDSGQLSLIKRGLGSAIPGCVADANVVLQHYDVQPRVGLNLAYILAYLAVLHLATYLALRVATNRAVKVKT